jgi:hypothetical protein
MAEHDAAAHVAATGVLANAGRKGTRGDERKVPLPSSLPTDVWSTAEPPFAS